MSDGKAKAEPRIVPFVEWFAEYKGGYIDTEFTQRIRDVLDAVQDTGKAGEVSLKLKITRRSDNQVEIVEEIKDKTPEHDRSTAIYFRDKHGNLTRNDPQQEVLPFKRGAKAAGSDGDE